jgi:iron-sulfur cluster repair protein YtfE (RIC family)
MKEESIRAYFEADHDRLDGLFKRFQELKRTDFPKAKDCFKEFKTGLQRHIIWEEEILFPLFEQKTGIARGPTEVMRMEHRQIRDHLEAIHKKVHEHDPESDQDERSLLLVLFAHNQKEEGILYPAINRLADGADRAGVFKAMKEIPEERYDTCCEEG